MKKLMKKMLEVFLFVLVVASFSIPVLAEGNTHENTKTGQTIISYTPDKKPPVKEVPKGNGKPAKSPATGDQNLTKVLELLITASVSMLMLIIFILIRKRRIIS